MNDTIRLLRWPWILGLGSLALVRPIVRIVQDLAGVDSSLAATVGITAGVTAVWVVAVGCSRVAAPVLTLTCAGVVYGVLAVALSGVLSPILEGELAGPIANPIAIVPVLGLNAGWGAAAGVLALLMQWTRGVRSPADQRT